MREPAILSQLVELSKKKKKIRMLVPHALSFWFDWFRVRPGILYERAVPGVQDP